MYANAVFRLDNQNELTNLAPPKYCPPMKYQAIIFDLDGTLIDSMQLWRQVDEEFLQKRGIPVPPDLFDLLPQGNSFIQTAQHFKDRFGLGDSVESIMQEWTQMVREHYTKGVPLKPGVRELLDLLATSGVKMGIGTSNSMELARLVLSAHGIWHYFQGWGTGDMDLRGKPFPDIFLRSAQDLGVSPQSCIAVEDTLSGVTAARAAGMRVYAIYDADSHPFWDQIQALAHLSYEDYNSLSPILQGELGINTGA